MTDVPMYRHMQEYREEWHETKEAVDANVDHSHRALQIQTKQWVRRILPLDTVEEEYQEIFHERQLGPYSGLKDAYENGLRGGTSNPNQEDLLDVEVLKEIAAAAEEITVDVVDLPEQEPVDVEPWDPDSEQTAERVSELKEETPDYDE